MTTETRADAFAGSLLAARRERGLTLADLARASGLPESTVREAEQGVAVPPAAVHGLCVALSMDPAPHVPGLGPVRSAFLDADHAKVVDYLEDLAAREGDTLVLPDVAAMTERFGMTEAERAVIDAGAKRWSASEWLMTIGLAGIPTTVLAVMTGMLAWNEHLASIALLGGLGSSTAMAMAGIVTCSSRLGEGTWRRVRKQEVDAWFAARLKLSRTGYALARDAVTVVVVEDGEVRRREMLASSFTSVEVVDEDVDHVTVRVDGLLGRFEMSWLPRTRDLTDTVSSWSPRGGRPYLDGPQ